MYSVLALPSSDEVKQVRSTENIVSALALVSTAPSPAIAPAELGYCRPPLQEQLAMEDAKIQLLDIASLPPTEAGTSYGTVRTMNTSVLSTSGTDIVAPPTIVAALIESPEVTANSADGREPKLRKPKMGVDAIKQIWAMRGPIITTLAVVLLLPMALSEYRETRCGYVVLVMAILWLTEAIPIPATALLPIFMFPICGVETAKNVSKNYVNDTSMLFMGGLIVAVAVEEWKLHKRIAVAVLRIVGSDPKFVMLGLMLPTWFLSMWVSNTATASMMIPIAHAVMQQMGSCRKSNTSRVTPGGKNISSNANDKPDEKYTYVGESDVDKTSPYKVQIQDAATQDLQKQQNAGLDGLEIPPTQAETTLTVQPPGQPDAVPKKFDDEEGEGAEDSAEFILLCKGLCLCIAYGCNIGGIATLTGTPPNLVMKGIADELFNDRYEELKLTERPGSGITFANWMGFALPLSAITLVLGWIVLMLLFLRGNICKKIPQEQKEGVKAIIMQEWKQLGPFTLAELEITILFCFLATMWVSRDPKTSPGWSVWFMKGYVSDSSAVMIIVLLLFLLPAQVPRVFCLRKPEHEKLPYYRPLLTWEQVHRKLPWGVIFLLGGGFALAKACQESGLSKWLGNELTGLASMDTWVLNLILCIVVAMATEVTSNTATATLLMPVMANIALSVQVNPLYLMASAGVATSFAFMLPVATPPNAIVFSYGSLRVFDMAFAGFFMNIVAVLCLTLAVNTWGNAIYDLETTPSIFVNMTQIPTPNATTC